MVSSKLAERSTDKTIEMDKWGFEATHWKAVIPLTEAESIDLDFAAGIRFGSAGRQIYHISYQD